MLQEAAKAASAVKYAEAKIFSVLKTQCGTFFAKHLAKLLREHDKNPEDDC